MPALDLAAFVKTPASEQTAFMVTVPAVYALLLRRPKLAAADVTAVRWLCDGTIALAEPTLDHPPVRSDEPCP